MNKEATKKKGDKKEDGSEDDEMNSNEGTTISSDEEWPLDQNHRKAAQL